MDERTTSVRVASLRSVSSRMSKFTSGWRGSRSSSIWFASPSNHTSTSLSAAGFVAIFSLASMNKSAR